MRDERRVKPLWIGIIRHGLSLLAIIIKYAVREFGISFFRGEEEFP